MFYEPIPLTDLVLLCGFKWVLSQFENLRHTQIDEKLCPQVHYVGALFSKDGLPIPETNCDNLAEVVGSE